MVNSIVTASATSTSVTPLNSFTEYAEKYQTYEADWGYSTNVAPGIKSALASGRLVDGTQGLALSATDGIYTKYTHENDNIILVRAKLTNRVVKRVLPTGTALVSGPMSLEFSARPTGWEFGGPFAPDHGGYGDLSAPSGIGLRGGISTLSSNGGDFGLVERAIWDPTVHTEYIKDSGWQSNGVLVPRYWGAFIQGGGVGIPFYRKALGQADPTGSYLEQNGDRIWLDPWTVEGTDTDPNNDATYNNDVLLSKILELFVDPNAGSGDIGLSVSHDYVPNPKYGVDHTTRGLPVYFIGNQYQEIWFPMDDARFGYNSQIPAPFSKTNPVYVARNTNLERNDMVVGIAEAVGRGDFFGAGVLPHLSINMDPINPSVFLEALSIRDAWMNVQGWGPPILYSPQWCQDYLELNVECDVLGWITSTAPTNVWSEFWSDRIPHIPQA